MVEVKLRGQRIEGRPITWDKERVFLMGRDGRLWKIPYSQVTNYRRSPDDFSSNSVGEMRALLLREFGREFEVASTGHYLVVHPKGRRDRWSGRFEQLYRSLLHYFSVRKFQLREPEVPLVAVVFHRHEDFLRYATASGAKLGKGVLGYYSPISNRVVLYDRTDGDDRQDWSINASTIIHEATHQTAYNVGIHSRFAQQPRWLVEGLGTEFEAPGVWNSRLHVRKSDRVNRGRLAAFRQYASRRPRGSLAEFISSDRLFQTNPQAAYSQAWALTHYLIETQPAKYFRYLSLTASRPLGSDYNSPQRLSDFTSVFGENLGMLEANFLRYIEHLQ